MNYVFHQHYSISPNTFTADEDFRPIVLLAESDPETMAMYARQLNGADVSVCICVDMGQVPYHVSNLKPDILVLNPSPDFRLSFDIVKKSIAAHPHLSVITIGDLIPDQYLDQLMGLGVSFHINRSLSQPRDLVAAVRQILAKVF